MNNDKIAEHIIALERAAIEEWCRGNPSLFLELYAPELTFFDPFTPRCWDLDHKREMYERIRGQLDIEHFEMISPLVQLHGDFAVLIYNYTSSNSARVWNCTEVYRRFPGDGNRNGGDGDDDIGQWKIIHNHWSYVHPRQ